MQQWLEHSVNQSWYLNGTLRKVPTALIFLPDWALWIIENRFAWLVLYSQNTYGCDFWPNQHSRRFTVRAKVTMPKAEGRFAPTVERLGRAFFCIKICNFLEVWQGQSFLQEQKTAFISPNISAPSTKFDDVVKPYHIHNLLASLLWLPCHVRGNYYDYLIF